MDVVTLAKGLSDCLPVSELSDAELEELLEHAKVRRFDRGEVVYHQGDPSRDLFVLVEGSVKIVREDEAGHEVLLWVLERGGIFGQQAIFGTPRPVAALAVDDTVAIAVPGSACTRVLERNPRVMYRAFEMIERRLDRLTQSLEDVMLLDVRGRIAKYLLDATTGDGQGAALDLTQDELAAAVGSTRVTVNKVLADLEQRGLVRVGRRHVEVVAPAALRAEIRL